MDTTEWVLIAYFVPFLLGMFGGGCAALIAKWGILKFIVELDYRLSDCEARVNREVKIRAGEKGTAARNKSDELVEWAKDRAPEGHPPQLNFGDWRKSKMIGK